MSTSRRDSPETLRRHLAERLRTGEGIDRGEEILEASRPRRSGDARAAGVRISPDEYDLLREREPFVEAVQEGLADAEAGRTMTNEELGARLDEHFGPLDDG
jgi:hypothetical protein